MFTKILIANRGEIACRIIKTANTMGIRTVAVFSDADRTALHVKQADEAVHIGAAASAESYLLGGRIIQAALKTGAQAIHPGYGFLSENAEFAALCAENNLVFIGPPIAAIEAMGSKSAAKNIMADAQVPLVPGYHGDDQAPELLKKSADKMGYPVLLKAVAGGGGKGMRQVWSEEEFGNALTQAKGEAMASFGDDKMLVEKYLTQPRHVEVQVFCDTRGNGVYLFERDCSVQRRHQKIIEEAPAPGLPDEVRIAIGESAVTAAKAIDYEGAGTVEFLYDTDGAYYFMEMNTRLQVEHPVTEMITGQDLVEWQLLVANGDALPLQQDELSIDGHAFEARIYAEDPNNDFLPTAGVLTHLQTPTENQHVRVDTGVVQGDEVSPFYDPMIAKLVVWDKDRQHALNRLANALDSYQIAGVTTNIAFLSKLARNPAFVDADLDTGFIEKHHTSLFETDESRTNGYVPLICLYLILQSETRNSRAHQDPWEHLGAWRLNQPTEYAYEIIIEGHPYHLAAREETKHSTRNFHITAHGEGLNVSVTANASLLEHTVTAEIDGHLQRVRFSPTDSGYTLFGQLGMLNFAVTQADFGAADKVNMDTNFTAPMNGTVVDVLVSAGDTVSEGDPLIVMEAMKMQHTIHAPHNGLIEEVFYSSGNLVDGGAELLSFQPLEPE